MVITDCRPNHEKRCNGTSRLLRSDCRRAAVTHVSGVIDRHGSPLSMGVSLHVACMHRKMATKPPGEGRPQGRPFAACATLQAVRLLRGKLVREAFSADIE
jgi:hypothetical protein